MALELFRPRYCVWELTLACNLRCGHCGSSAGCARANELTTEESLDLVRQLADLECRLITLSGGEPTLRQDWTAIAGEAIGRGIVVNMVTNGTTMTEELAARIADSGLANVAVSLDGPEALHDENRGPGSFRRAARGLELLAAHGVPTAVLTHLDVRSAARLEEIHDLAVDLGARAFRVQLGKPMGELALRPERLLQPEALLDLLPRLARLKKRSSIWVDVGDSIGYYGPHERLLRTKGWGGMRNEWSGCQAGRYAIGIESDGGIKGCLSLQADLKGCEGRDPFLEGNVRERRLADLWFDPTAFAFNRREGTDGLTGECARCARASLCRGGAKCVASAFTGALGEDPYCFTRVARLQARKGSLPRRQRAAAAAIAGLGACLGACLVPTEESDPPAVVEDAGPQERDAGQSLDAGEPSDAGQGLDAGSAPDAGVDCSNVCCDCEYGAPPPPECCAQDAGPAPDPCEGVCCDCDYGIPPPPECCAQDAGPAPDPCANVCCDCDYGIPPPPECCD